MKTTTTGLGMLVLGFALGWGLKPDSNASLVYGDTGLPANCRAIIVENINGYQRGEYSAKDVIASLDRNCGAAGYSWAEGAKRPFVFPFQK